MRKLVFRYVKYILTALMSTALTVRFLTTWRGRSVREEGPIVVQTQGVSRGLLSDSDRDLSTAIPPKRRPHLLKPSPRPGWVVLPGNVTVHVGKEDNPHNYTYILNPSAICESLDKSRLSVLVYVESDVKNEARRQAIRDTWGLAALQRALNFRVVFLLGSAAKQERVLEESFRYGDIVQEDFPESFRHLSLKSVMGLKWATTFCQRADYLVKTDDDLFLHLPNLRQLLAKNPGSDLLCHENRRRRILRKQLLKGLPERYVKYEVQETDLPGLYFPPYCAGMAYISSRKVAQRLLQAALLTPYFFIEDVYITGFCRQKAGLALTDTPTITLKPPVMSWQGSCAFRDGRITSQELTATEMRELWAEVNTQGYFCPQVVGLINS